MQKAHSLNTDRPDRYSGTGALCAPGFVTVNQAVRRAVVAADFFAIFQLWQNAVCQLFT
jgi:hypothetical protein